MADKQLNVWIPEDLRNYIAERAAEEKRGMNAIIAELIQRDMAARHGEIVEHNSLVVVREMLVEEMRQAHAQLRGQLREDRASEAEIQQEWIQKRIDRVASLVVMAVRAAGIARRLVYTSLSKAYGPDFAKLTFEDAKERVQLELLPKKAVKDHVQRGDNQ